MEDFGCIQDEFKTNLRQINGWLKSGMTGVRILQRGKTLSLVATINKKQETLSTGLKANEQGLRQARSLALQLAGDLLEKPFPWGKWGKEPAPEKEELMVELAKGYRQYWLRIYGDDIRREGTWQKDYHAVIRQLPSDLTLDTDHIRQYVMEATEPNSRARKKFCTVIVAIAKFGGVDLNLSDLRGKYSGSRGQRKLPSDQQIVEIGLNIANPGWQWIYGMLATFGLRNHEVFFIDQEYLSSSGICHVLEGKTFDGKVWPFYSEWVDLFDLKNIKLPNIRPGRLHIQYGQKVSKFFQREKIPFNAYSLRHCWARRTIDLGLDSRLAAKQMRHSHQVHTTTYNQWLGDEIHQQEWERIKEENPWDKQGS